MWYMSAPGGRWYVTNENNPLCLRTGGRCKTVNNTANQMPNGAPQNEGRLYLLVILLLYVFDKYLTCIYRFQMSTK